MTPIAVVTTAFLIGGDDLRRLVGEVVAMNLHLLLHLLLHLRFGGESWLVKKIKIKDHQCPTPCKKK